MPYILKLEGDKKMNKGKNKIPVYKNPDKPIEERVNDLLTGLTLEEKISQMVYNSSAIGRLGISEYNWWNECLHGVAEAGIATVFPQSIGLAAAFDQEMMKEVGNVTSDEARAKYHEFVRQEDRDIHKGLTFWSPNVNIFRDPRWGRGQETYGEDPYLSGRLGVNFIKGLQGDDPDYLKSAACAKHFVVHSGPESERHEFNVEVSKKDLRETYLPVFRDCIKEARVEAVMGAYNRVNGEPCCASKTLLQDILRDEWGFEGHVVSDCGAILDIHQHHKVTDTPEESAALAVNNGCDLNCGKVFKYLLSAVEQGLISESTIDKSVKRLLKTRFKLGMFDPEDRVPYTQIPFEVNDCEEHRQFARGTACKSMVLLKNKDVLLPLNLKKLNSIAVIGPNADNKKSLLGNYCGTPSKSITPLEGIRNKVGKNAKIYYAEGCDLIAEGCDLITRREINIWGKKPSRGFSEAVACAQRSDVVIMFLGLSPDLEGEEGEAVNSDANGDKTDLNLPGMQEELLKTVFATGKPIVLVLLNGSPLTINWAQDNIPSILEAWYPGEEGGNAIADVLFGDYNPGGRLPVTFVKSIKQLPDFHDYSMSNRTYRYMKEKPLYPFGYGLSYTQFTYSEIESNKITFKSNESGPLVVKIRVKNIGDKTGAEVVQLYIKDVEASVRVPHWELKGFKRIMLEPGVEKTVSFTLAQKSLSLIDEEGRRKLEPGKFILSIGGQQPDQRSWELTGDEVRKIEITVTGDVTKLIY